MFLTTEVRPDQRQKPIIPSGISMRRAGSQMLSHHLLPARAGITRGRDWKQRKPDGLILRVRVPYAIPSDHPRRPACFIPNLTH